MIFEKYNKHAKLKANITGILIEFFRELNKKQVY